MIEASCHCGAVRIETDEAPETVTECNCSICRRLGTLWAYYSPSSVRITPPEGATTSYAWGEKIARAPFVQDLPLHHALGRD